VNETLAVLPTVVVSFPPTVTLFVTVSADADGANTSRLGAMSAPSARSWIGRRGLSQPRRFTPAGAVDI